MDTKTDKVAQIVARMAELAPKLTERQQDQLIAFGDGLALFVERGKQ